MKKILFYFDETNPMHRSKYQEAYGELATQLLSLNCRVYLAQEQASYLGESRFHCYQTFTADGFQTCGQDVTIDVVYKKGQGTFDETGLVVVNPQALEDVTVDKTAMYETFQDYAPKWFSVRTQSELRTAINQLPGRLIVLKPVRGFDGQGVVIDELEQLWDFRPGGEYIAQEFIDTSGGIPGITDTYHDLRILMIEDRPVLSFFRNPGEGKYTSGVATGGRLESIDLDRIPEGAMEVARYTESILGHLPRRVYAVDVGLNRDGIWQIIEVNTRVGIHPKSYGKHYEYHIQELAKILAR